MAYVIERRSHFHTIKSCWFEFADASGFEHWSSSDKSANKFKFEYLAREQAFKLKSCDTKDLLIIHDTASSRKVFIQASDLFVQQAETYWVLVKTAPNVDDGKRFFSYQSESGPVWTSDYTGRAMRFSSADNAECYRTEFLRMSSDHVTAVFSNDIQYWVGHLWNETPAVIPRVDLPKRIAYSFFYNIDEKKYYFLWKDQRFQRAVWTVSRELNPVNSEIHAQRIIDVLNLEE